MDETIRSLIRKKGACVLATAAGGQPHCSLMSYVADETCREFYMLTLSGTRKYENLLANSAVSLLIDTRDEDVRRQEEVRALTVTGVFKKMDDPQKEADILRKLFTRHPHLRELPLNGPVKVITVQAAAFQLLVGLRRARIEEADG